MDFHDIVNPLPVFVMSGFLGFPGTGFALTALDPVSYTHLRAHET